MIRTGLPNFDVQGHRGCRGLMPENTIPAFIKALEIGVTTLELDVVITSDKKVLVSHDPFMSHEICRTPDGNRIKKSEQKSHNIYRMNAGLAQQYDCGMKVSKKFPKQQKIKVFKPLLSEVIDAVESYIELHHLKPVHYNIETKCTPAGDNIFHPSPAVFSDLLMEVIKTKKIMSRTMVQSFDVRTLQHLKLQGSNVELVLLVENLRSISYNLKKLKFNPDIYSPWYRLINKKDIKFFHDHGMRVIPWTVNKTDDMKRLIDKGVDGIITDYPDRLVEVLKMR